MALPLVGQGLLIIEAVRLHSVTIVGGTPLDDLSAQRRGLYLTAHNTYKDNALGGIPTLNPSKAAAADPCVRPRGHRDRYQTFYSTKVIMQKTCSTVPYDSDDSIAHLEPSTAWNVFQYAMFKIRFKRENVKTGSVSIITKKRMGKFTEIDLTVTVVIDIWREACTAAFPWFLHTHMKSPNNIS
jgi:hypothetical protein